MGGAEPPAGEVPGEEGVAREKDDARKGRLPGGHQPDGVGRGLAGLAVWGIADRDRRREVAHPDRHPGRDGKVGPYPDGRRRPLPEDRPVDLAGHRQRSGRCREIALEPPAPPEEEEGEGAGGEGRGRAREEERRDGEGEGEGRDPPGRPGRPDHR